MDLSSPDKLIIGERRRRLVDLRVSGETLEAAASIISEEFHLPNYNRSRAHEDFMAALAKSNKLTADEICAYRKLEENRLDFMFARLLPGIQASDVKSIEAGIKICHRKARLLGLDMANQAIVESTVDRELNQALNELQNNLRPDEYRQVLEVLSRRTDPLKLGDLEEDD